MDTNTNKYFNIVIGAIVVIGIAFYLYSKPTVQPVQTVDQPTHTNPIDIKSVDYSKGFSMNYITTQEWPLKVVLGTEPFVCNENSGSETKKKINGQTYCIHTESEGAAGSTYTTYTYTTALDTRLATVLFTLRFVQCGNYDEPKQSECKKEQAAFNPDTVALFAFERQLKQLVPSGASFGVALNWKKDTSVPFSDGLKVTLKDITDSRCPKDVQCIWAGEIAGNFSISGGSAGDEEQIITLSTMKSQTVTSGPYLFTLKNASPTSMIVVVTKK